MTYNVVLLHSTEIKVSDLVASTHALKASGCICLDIFLDRTFVIQFCNATEKHLQYVLNSPKFSCRYHRWSFGTSREEIAGLPIPSTEMFKKPTDNRLRCPPPLLKQSCCGILHLHVLSLLCCIPSSWNAIELMSWFHMCASDWIPRSTVELQLASKTNVRSLLISVVVPVSCFHAVGHLYVQRQLDQTSTIALCA